MLIGKGLIANAFNKYIDIGDIFIYASGVSNSNEKDNKEFLREKELVNKYIEQYKNKIFIYFSSCSLEDNELKNTPYHIHKLDIEQLIQSKCNNYLIFRLPNIIGFNGNINNIVNFFFEMIQKEQKFIVWQNATRNIVDVEDVYKIASYIIDNKICTNSIINIAYNVNTSIVDLIQSIEIILNKQANYNKVDKGVDMKIDNRLIQPIMNKLSIVQPNLLNLINKYKRI